MDTIAVIGAGMVGSTTAQRIAERQLADVVLLDIVEGMPQGKALDLRQAASLEGYDVDILGTNDYADIEDADMVIITAGVPRKPGMSREELVSVNSSIVKEVCTNVAEHSPDSIVIVVTNPLDVMVYAANQYLDFGRHRVFGMGGVLDAARLAYFVAESVGCSYSDVSAMVLGGHGAKMLPLPRYTTVRGIPITQLLSAEDIDAVVGHTIEGGAEIVSLLKSGSAYYAPSAAIVHMVDAILKDRGSVVCASVLLEGEYGIEGSCTGVPVVLGACGLDHIIELPLSGDEMSRLREAADEVVRLSASV
ncbi:MAG: malate dehydrogenase [Methermicoccaceae archaeon]